MKLNIDFWRDKTKEIFQKLFERLYEEKGFSKQEAKEFLESLYYAVSAEYGE